LSEPLNPGYGIAPRETSPEHEPIFSFMAKL
jgi:hypothetical protein